MKSNSSQGKKKIRKEKNLVGCHNISQYDIINLSTIFLLYSAINIVAKIIFILQREIIFLPKWIEMEGIQEGLEDL